MRTLCRRASALLLGATCLHTMQGICEAEEPRTSQPCDAVQRDIPGLIVALDHRLYAQRQRATEQLRAAGLQAVAHLAHTVQEGSLEAADRSVGILEDFAATDDRPLKLASLEALVEARQFPSARRQADHRLTQLCEAICIERFAELGAKCEITRYCPPSSLRQTRVALTISPESWEGNPSSFELLRGLRQLDMLKIDAPMVDDHVAMRLASLPHLRMLELINTHTSLQLITELQQHYPQLHVRVRSRSYLGVQFWPEGALEVMMVEHDSPADHAGLAEGDQVVAVNDAPVETFASLTAHIAQHAPGTTITVKVRRGNELLETKATLKSRNWSTDN